MRTIIHVSDIHFGKFDPVFLEPMLAAFRVISPDLIIISGDLTQRARTKEYEAAEGFLNRLEKPYFVIPGNHDIRAFAALPQRVFRPYERYKDYVSRGLEPVWSDNELAIASIDTVRHLRIKNGRVSLNQAKRVHDWFNSIKRINPDTVQILVTHHPVTMPVGESNNLLAAKSPKVIHELARTGIDMFLSGHYHKSIIGHTAEKHNLEGYSAIFIQAGTVSTRQRKEVQSFNVITVDRTEILVNTYFWNWEKNIFEPGSRNTFTGTSGNWKEKK